ncbi:unnamed protein product [Effrenium voratum]|nr:unnamed protein product [Effrenium voratum]
MEASIVVDSDDEAERCAEAEARAAAAAHALAAEPPQECFCCRLALPPSRGLLTPQPVGEVQIWRQDQALIFSPEDAEEDDDLVIPVAGISSVDVKADGPMIILTLSPPLAANGFAVDYMAEGHRIATVTLSPLTEELRSALATLMAWLQHLTLHGPKALGLVPRPLQEPVALRLHGTVLEERDLDLLEDEQWFNDTIMDFFMRLALEVAAPQQLQDELYVAKTQFFTRLTACGASSGEKGWENVKTWTRTVNGGVASQRVLVYPVNEANLHWCVFFVCHPHGAIQQTEADEDVPRIVCLDSAWEPVPKDDHIKLLKGYLRRELFNNPLGGNGAAVLGADGSVAAASVARWKAAVMGLEKMQAIDGDVPKQQNVYDCGLYVLEFLLYLLRQPGQFSRLGLESHQEWFDQSVITHRRTQMRELVSRLLSEGKRSGQMDVSLLLRDESLRNAVREALTSEPPEPENPEPENPEPENPEENVPWRPPAEPAHWSAMSAMSAAGGAEGVWGAWGWSYEWEHVAKRARLADWPFSSFYMPSARACVSPTWPFGVGRDRGRSSWQFGHVESPGGNEFSAARPLAGADCGVMVLEHV